MTPPLRTFYVYLTGGCNCACRHCWIVPAADGRSATGGECLDPALLRTAIEQALPLGLTRLKWTGGEPTLHPQFAECLALQQEYRLSASLETNGMLLDDRLAARLLAAGVDSVSVSLDGARPQTHDAIRGVAGGFARSVRGIRALISAGCRPELIFTVQPANLAEIDEFLAVAAELGAASVKFNILQPMLRGAELAESGGAPAVAELITLAQRLAARDPGDGVPATLDIPLAFRPLDRLIAGSAGGTCSILTILGILPRGEYALCGIGQQVPALAMGAVATSRLATVWASHPVLRALREGLPGRLQGICGECLMKAACLGSCLAANYHQSGELFAPFWFCREAAAAGLFPASRLAGLQL